MALQTRSSFDEFFQEEMKRVFGDELLGRESSQRVLFERIYDSMPIDGPFVRLQEIAGVGDHVAKDELSPAATTTIEPGVEVILTPITFAISTTWSREWMEDNRFQMFTEASGDLKKSGLRSQEQNLVDHLQSNPIGADGVPLFSNAHPTNFGTFTNIGPSISSLTEASVAVDVQIMATQRMANGAPMTNIPKYILVSPDNFTPGFKLFDSTLSVDNVATGITNQSNPFGRSGRNRFGYFDGGLLVSNFLEGPDYYLRSDMFQGLVRVDRAPLKLEMDTNITIQGLVAVSSYRQAVGVKDPRSIYLRQG